MDEGGFICLLVPFSWTNGMNVGSPCIAGRYVGLLKHVGTPLTMNCSKTAPTSWVHGLALAQLDTYGRAAARFASSYHETLLRVLLERRKQGRKQNPFCCGRPGFECPRLRSTKAPGRMCGLGPKVGRLGVAGDARMMRGLLAKGSAVGFS